MREETKNITENIIKNIRMDVADGINSFVIRAKYRATNSICAKKEGAAELVVVVILIIISIALCTMYKTEAAKFFKSIFTKLTTDATALFAEAKSA